MKTIEQQLAEEATGIVQSTRGIGQLYAGPINRKGLVSDPGFEINSAPDAYNWLRDGGCVAIPNAGAGSYRAAFDAMLFPKCEVFENMSSAGDWSFAVFDGESWFPASQSNRYPRHGFNYSVNFDWSFSTKEECFEFMAAN